MDLPATQVIENEECTSTQHKMIKKNENTLVGILLIDGKQHLIVSGITTIGRHPRCRIIINHETVSKKHAEIESETIDGSFFIKDLNSSNMTKINNTKLRPKTCYQIKDGDKLTFGKVIATFKVLNSSDDSCIISTPKINKIIHSVIPSTPDSLIDASSNSENDMSAIFGTQTDKVKISISNEQRKSEPTSNTDNFSSLSKHKNNENNFSDIQSHKFVINHTNKNYNNNSFYHVEMCKSNFINQCNGSNENIYEMETQRPFNFNENNVDIKNLAYEQQFNCQISDSDKHKSNCVTIYDADTQKIDSTDFKFESITNSEMQQFHNKKFEYTEEKLNKPIDIFSTEIQKINYKISTNEFNDHLKIHQFIPRTLNDNQIKLKDNINELKDITIYNAETQKIGSPTSVDSIENWETQKFNSELLNSIKEESNNESEQSIYTAETQKIISEELRDQSSNLNQSPNCFSPNISKPITVINSLQIKNYNNFSENKFSIPKTFGNSKVIGKQMKNIIFNKDEDEMFNSQNLIQDCQLEFFSENVYNESINIQKKITKLEECKTNYNINNILEISTNLNNINNFNKNKEDCSENNQSIIDNNVLVNSLNEIYKIDENKQLDAKSCGRKSLKEKYFFVKKNESKTFNKDSHYSKNKQIQKEIKSDSETDEEGIFSNYLSEEINISSGENNFCNEVDVNVKQYTDITEENFNYTNHKTLSKKIKIILESTDSEDSMFGDCDDENKDYKQKNENAKKLFNNTIFDKKMDPCFSLKTQNINYESNQLINATLSNSCNRSKTNIVTNTNDSTPTLITKKQISPLKKTIKELNNEFTSNSKKKETLQFNELHSSKVINKLDVINTETFRNDHLETVSNLVINETEQKILSNSSKRQIEELLKCNKKYKKDKDYQNEKIYINTSNNKVLDKVLKEYQETSVFDSMSNKLNDNQNIDLSLSVLSPTLSSRKNSIRIKKNCKTNLFEKHNLICELKEPVNNLNDSIEKNLNKMFNNNSNTIDTITTQIYNPHEMLTQQLTSILDSQDFNQTEIEESIIKKSLNLSTNSKNKHRLSLSINLNNSLISKDQHEIEASKPDVNLNLGIGKNTLQNCKLNTKSQDNEIYLANLRKNNIFEHFQLKNELKNIQTPMENVKKQTYIKFSSINDTNECMAALELNNTNFIDNKRSYQTETLNKIPMDTSIKKRLCLTLPKDISLNLSQTSMNNQSIEKSISMDSEDILSSMPTVSLINKSNDSISSKHIIYKNNKNDINESSQDLHEDSQRQQFTKEVCTLNNLTCNTIASVEDCVNSDEDFLKNMPEIKVTGTGDSSVTNSQLFGLCDNNFNDEEKISASISPLNVVIPIKWNWYAHKRYDLIYQKKKSGTKIKNSYDDTSCSFNSTVSRSSDLNKILKEIESKGKRRVFNNSKRCIINDNDIPYSTRSKHLQKISLIESFPTSTGYEYDSNSDIDSDWTLDCIENRNDFTKCKSVEPIKLNSACYANDESDEEFELLRRRCEKMVAVPSFYKNTIITDNNSKRKLFTSKNYNVNMRSSENGNNNFFKITDNLNDNDINENDNDHSNSNNNVRMKRSNQIKASDNNTIVFQVSTGDLKDNTILKKPCLVLSQNNKLLKSMELNKSNHNFNKINTLNFQQPLKLQEVSVLISPLKETILSRFIDVNRTNINNIKSNFKQSNGNVTNKTTFRTSSNSSKTPIVLSLIEKNISKIDSENGLNRIQNQNALNCRKMKTEIPFELNGSLSTKNLFAKDFDVKSTLQEIKVRTTRYKKNKIAVSSLLKKNCDKDEGLDDNIKNHDRRIIRGRVTHQNNDLMAKKIFKSKLKSIFGKKSDLKESDNCSNLNKFKELKIISTKVSKKKENKSFKRLDLDKTEKTNCYETRARKKILSLNQIESFENLQSRTKKIKNIKILNTSKIKVANSIRTRSKQIMNITDSNLKKLQITVNKEIESKSDRICNQSKFLFSENSCNNEKNAFIKNNNLRSCSMKIRKRVHSSKEFQEKVDILKSVTTEDSKSNETCKKMIKNDNKIDSQASKFNTTNTCDRSITSNKRVDKNKFIASKWTPESNEISRSINQNLREMKTTCSFVPSTSPMSTSLRSKRLLSKFIMQQSYIILFTGDKSKIYSETVIKLGGSITEDPAKCSVLVTDKIRRTFKFLCSIARGIPILSLKWLDESIKAHRFLNWKNYILQDSSTEIEFNFKLLESLEKAKEKKLFEGYTIILTPNITQPPVSELKDMISFSGGKCLLRAPKKWTEKTVIIAKKDDLQSASKLIAKAPISITVYSTEFILSGILKQNINLDEFNLIN